MSVENVKSGSITLIDAGDRRKLNAAINRGLLLPFIETCRVASGASIGSTYRFFEVPSGLVPLFLWVSAPDIGTTPTGNIGLKKKGSSGAVIDADLFASSLSLKDGALETSFQLHESGVITPANRIKALWQLVPSPEEQDPDEDWELYMELVAAADAAGDVTIGLLGAIANR